ncbi:MAG: T9SS type A sorting domain-containing protein, partial [Candidatus Coatesbacteria bacterium]|nr:T9SS type A sorting domain-containing protein [Candidatus Coatesbacteria bacterium]
GGESWEVGSHQTVEWQCPNEGRVMIFYSTDGNNGTFKEIFRGTGATKNFSWTIPDEPSDNCWVKGYWADNEYKEDLSDAAFSIVPTKYITVIKPNGGERWRVGSQQTVQWSCPDNGRVMIFYSSNGKNGNFKEIYRGNADTKSFKWTIPDDKSNDCWVKGYWADYEYREDLSDASFSITDQNGFENETTTETCKNIVECYPSPFNTHLKLELVEGAIIYSLTGQIIMKLSKGKHLIDASNWIDGVYIIKSGNETKKVIKISK